MLFTGSCKSKTQVTKALNWLLDIKDPKSDKNKETDKSKSTPSSKKD